MIIKIFSIGKIKNSYIKEGEEEYLKRLSASPFRIERQELNAEQNQEEEADNLLDRLKDDDFLILLDERGKEMTSPQLAQHLQEHMNSGRKSITFAIGGAYGWHEKIYKRAHIKLSLSALTFPFQLVRLILIEQLYRSHSIISGAPYHKA